MATIIGFSMTACGGNNGGDVRIDLPPAGDGSIGTGDWPMIFEGVVDEQGNPVNTTIDFTRTSIGEDEGGKDISTLAGWEVSLRGDTLSLTLGTVGEGYLWYADETIAEDFGPGFSVTRGLMMVGLEGFSDGVNNSIYPGFGYDILPFLYANIAGAVRGIAEFYDDEDGITFVLMINLTLKPGWNTVIETLEWDEVSRTYTTTVLTGPLGDGAVWVLWQWDGYSAPIGAGAGMELPSQASRLLRTRR